MQGDVTEHAALAVAAFDNHILPGVKIGRNSFIGAGSVIIKNIPENSVVYGNPSKIIGNINDKKYKEKI